MKIGITDTMHSEDRFASYADWFLRENSAIEIIKLSYKLDNLDNMDQCDGIVVSGGNDVDPALYKGPVGHPKIKDIDSKRDDFERKIVDRLMSDRKPFLAICRGMQLVNVHLGGTLIPDIQEAGYGSHHAVGGPEIQHSISIDSVSSLRKITGAPEGTVNSYHHQAVDRPGTGLRITAVADDGIIEAMEIDGAFGHLLQWHPERMNDLNNPLTKSILESFLSTIQHS